jgi:transcriptional regulator with XRE-family HTH domain
MSENPLLQTLAANLRVVRERTGMTRDRLAAAANVDPQTVKRIEHARANPMLVVLSRLSAAMAVSLTLLLTGDLAAGTVETVAEVEAFDSDVVGDTLVVLRKSRGLSQRGVAAAANLQTLTLSRYENATADPRLLSLTPLANALGLDTLELIRTIERRHRLAAESRSGWHLVAEGIRRRVVATTEHSRLWEWRIAPGSAYEGERLVDGAEEMITAIRGTVRVHQGDAERRLRRGATVPLNGGLRRFVNAGSSTARLLLFEVVK